MKRFIFYILPLIISSACFAVDYEATSSTNAVQSSSLAVIPRSDPGDILGSVLINNRGNAAETLTIYDSSGVASNSFGVINISSGVLTSNEYIYNIRISSAITFSKSGTGADVTIIWKNVR